ncbi:hypothetical protein BJX64DRAFT_137959 [Aspergillus heterothallicus]
MPGLLSSLSACIGLYTIEQPPPSSTRRRRAVRRVEVRRPEPPRPIAPNAPPAAPPPPPGVPPIDTWNVRGARPAQATHPPQEPRPARQSRPVHERRFVPDPPPVQATHPSQEPHPERQSGPGQERRFVPNTQPLRDDQFPPGPFEKRTVLPENPQPPVPKFQVVSEQDAFRQYDYPRNWSYFNHDPCEWSDAESTRAQVDYAPIDVPPQSKHTAPHVDDGFVAKGGSSRHWTAPGQDASYFGFWGQTAAFEYPTLVSPPAFVTDTDMPTGPRSTHPARADHHPGNGGCANFDQEYYHPMYSTLSSSPKERVVVGPLTAPPPPPSPESSGAGLPGNPRRARGSGSQVGYIWPKDPRPGNPERWSRGSRLKDVLTGKGPDMYVGRIGVRPRNELTAKLKRAQRGSERSRWSTERYWSLWGHEHELHCTAEHCDDCDRIDEQMLKDNLITSARRCNSERYDFRMRKYRMPDSGTWSDVIYCDERRHTVAKEIRDCEGRWYPANQWHDYVHGPHTD